jgi:uncharacterized protein (TIGR02001 family)
VTRRTAQRSGAAPAGATGRCPWALLAGATIVALGAAPGARAEGSWNGSIGVTSDYVLRGVSQTYGGAALQLGASYQDTLGWFVGAWGSNVNPYPAGEPSRELDLYAGYARALGSDFTTRVAYTHYSYLADPRPTRYDYDEFALTATYVDRLSFTVSYQPNASAYSRLGYAHDQAAFSLELSGRWPLPRDFALTAGAGYYDLQRLFGIRYWAGSAGVAYVTRHFEVDLARYFATAGVARLYEDASTDGRVVLSGYVRF